MKKGKTMILNTCHQTLVMDGNCLRVGIWRIGTLQNQAVTMHIARMIKIVPVTRVYWETEHAVVTVHWWMKEV